MSEVIVFTTRICPNCKILKQILDEKYIRYTEKDMSTPAALTELTMNNVFTMSAPVLQINDTFYTTTDLFDGGTIDRQKVDDIITKI